MIGHRVMGTTLLNTGDIAQGRAHFDRAIALYDPAEHRPLAMRFGADPRVSILCYRALDHWILGYPAAAHADADRALEDAREIGQAATLLYALFYTAATYLLCGNYQTADANIRELVALADEKGAVQWKGAAMLVRSWLAALTEKAADAVAALTAGLAAYRSTGATGWTQLYLSHLAKAYAELGQFDDAWRFSSEATTLIEASKETWWEADVRRRAGEIALMSPHPDAAKAHACFEQRSRLLAPSRQNPGSCALR